MPPEPPSNRKKQILIKLIPAGIPLGFVIYFFIWPALQDFLHNRQAGRPASYVPLLIFGGFFLVIILVIVAGVVKSVRRPANPATGADGHPPPRDEKPWLARADWAAGRVKSVGFPEAKFLLLWSVLALAISAPAVHAIPKEWQNGNHAILLVLLFPAAAIFLFGLSFVKWRSRRRFGDCFFELAQIPAPPGGTLEGMIQTGARLKLEHGLHLKISCIRRVVSGSGKNQSISETILWQDEKIYTAQANLSESEPGQSGIPVHFKLPADQPECYARGRESVFWRLDAKAKMSGPSFHAAFDVPVFKIAGAIAEADDEPDPTAALQEPVEEIRRDENSKIKISDGLNGREFYFPAARNLGMATLTTFLFLVFLGMFYALIVNLNHLSIIFEIGLGLFLVILGCLNFSLWLKSSRVTIDSNGVSVTKRWLIFSRTRQFSTNDVARFATKTGMQSGSQIFTDIKLIKRGGDDRFAVNTEKFREAFQDASLPEAGQIVSRFRTGPSGVTVAGNIANVTEANWLVAEMNKALGRKP
jgi:hypothetical protein